RWIGRTGRRAEAARVRRRWAAAGARSGALRPLRPGGRGAFGPRWPGRLRRPPGALAGPAGLAGAPPAVRRPTGGPSRADPSTSETEAFPVADTVHPAPRRERARRRRAGRAPPGCWCPPAPSVAHELPVSQPVGLVRLVAQTLPAI